MKFLFSLLFVCSFITGNAQKKGAITSDDLQLLPGKWHGMLAYTDYKDDSTQVKLDVELTVNATGANSFLLEAEYTEPNGKIIKDSAGLFINDTVSMVTYSGNIYTILRVRRTSSQLIIVTTADGKDNNKDAEIRHTFTISAKQLIILKEVRYLDGAKDFFTRNKLVVLK